MTQEVMYCFEDDEIQQVCQNMAEIQVRRLPVLNREKRFVGIVSLSDLAKKSPVKNHEAVDHRGAAAGLK